jgi:transcription elongation factor GreA
MTKENILVTKEGYEKLQKEVRMLEKEFAAVGYDKAEAAEVGGNVWHDNPAFETIEQKQKTLLRQISEAKDILSRAVIVEEELRMADKVKIGSIVEIEFEDGKLISVKIGDYTESDPAKGIISYKSPLGSALLGAAPGDECIYRVTERIIKVVIKAVQSGNSPQTK